MGLYTLQSRKGQAMVIAMKLEPFNWYWVNYDEEYLNDVSEKYPETVQEESETIQLTGEEIKNAFQGRPQLITNNSHIIWEFKLL